MPTLRFHSTDIERFAPVSDELVNKLAVAFDTSADNFSLEFISSKFIEKGVVKECGSYPLVEITAFKRAAKNEDRAAALITEYLMNIGYDYSEVVFIRVEPRYYYCAGEHCA